MWVHLTFTSSGPIPTRLSDTEIKIACEDELAETIRYARQRYGQVGEDYAGEALLHALRTFNPRLNVDWLAYRATIVKRFCVDHFRAAKKERIVQSLPLDSLKQIPTAPKQTWIEAFNNVFQAAEGLTDPLRSVLLLSAIAQISPSEISAVTEISLQSVKRSIYDLRQHLRSR